MAYTKYTVVDNLQSKLDANISSGATSFDVTAGDGSSFSVADGDLICTIVEYNDQSGTENNAKASGVSKREKVLVTGISTDTLTVTRGFDGDTPQSFDAGSYIYGFIVARHYEDLADLVNLSSADNNDFLVHDGTNFVNRNFLNPKVVTISDGATLATDASLGNMFKVTITDNRTMGAPTNPTDGQFIQYRITQDGTGSRTITWNAVFNFGGAGEPTLTTTADQTDYVSFRYNGDNSEWDYMGAALNY